MIHSSKVFRFQKPPSRHKLEGKCTLRRCKSAPQYYVAGVNKYWQMAKAVRRAFINSLNIRRLAHLVPAWTLAC